MVSIDDQPVTASQASGPGTPRQQPTEPATTSGGDEQRLLELIETIRPVVDEIAAAARAHHLRLTKPPGSMGEVETVGIRLAAMAGTTIPPRPSPATVVVFAGDHGVHDEGVSPWPQEVTAQMVANFCAGGAAVSVIAACNGLDLLVVNAGVATALDDHPLLMNHPVRAGTANLRLGAAMSRAEAAQAVLLGADTARQLVSSGTRCLLTGDMGIANTTSSAALIATLGAGQPERLTGRGTGIDDETLDRKATIVAEAATRATPLVDDPLAVVAEIGGLEIAALAGLCLGGAAAGIPVILDGVIAMAGAMMARSLAHEVTGYLIAGHRSVEPAASFALGELGLKPLVDLGLRLGEGSGAALAYPIVVVAADLMKDMATFDQAGVDGSSAGA